MPCRYFQRGKMAEAIGLVRTARVISAVLAWFLGFSHPRSGKIFDDLNVS
jgi:hypothetical protein